MADHKLSSGPTASSTPKGGDIARAPAAGQARRYHPQRVRPHAQQVIDKLCAGHDRLEILGSLSELLPLAVSTLLQCSWVLQTFATTAQEGRLAAVVGIDEEDCAPQNVLIHASSLLNEACIMLGSVEDFGARHERIDDPLWGFSLARDLWHAKSVLAMITTVFSFEEEVEAWSQCELGILSLIECLKDFGHEINRAMQVLDAQRASGVAASSQVVSSSRGARTTRKAAEAASEVMA